MTYPCRFLCLLFFIPLGSRSQASFAVSLIPDSMKTNAHEVLRDYSEIVTVNSAGKATDKVHMVMTILDESGKKNLIFLAYSNAFRKLDDADIEVYDAKGLPLQHIKQKEMDVEGYGEGLVEDAQYTYFLVTAPSYPLTVEMNHTTSLKGVESYPSFTLNNTVCSIEHSEYILTSPKSLPIRYKDHLLTLKPLIEDGGKDAQTYTWKTGGIRARALEKEAPSDAVPEVSIAPTQFELGGFAGNMSTWQQYGQWIYDLNKETFALPEASKQVYRTMVAGASTDADKARILYTYLQKNFRYVSIQLGIGGLRSYPAVFTEKKKFGDCKALSTYMCACLDAVGVKSYTALINAGEGEVPVDPTFPEDGFDHVILCIPEPKDSIWLECTSNRTDFGILGAFTENRNALLITEKGGVLVHTPTARVEENMDAFNTQITLADDGSGKATVSIRSTGDPKWAEISNLYEETHDNQKSYLINALDFKQPDDFTITLEKIDTPVFRAALQMSFDKIPDFSAGSKMFLNTRLYHIWQHTLPPSDNRTQGYRFSYPFCHSDTTSYTLPDGYEVDDLPKGQTLTCPYATYTSSYWYDKSHQTVYSAGTLQLKVLSVPAKDYAGVKLFFSQVITDETEKIVINKP